MFTVFTPAYNAARYIRATIESIQKQTFREYEHLIAVDLGSTDDTVAIAHEYAAADPKIRVIEVEHCGIAAKMNIGLREAKYEWYVNLDSDDIAMPNRLETLRKAILSRKDVIAWAGDSVHFNDLGRELYISELGPTNDQDFYGWRDSGSPIMMNINTMAIHIPTALRIGGFDERFKVVGDMDLIDRLSDAGVMLRIPQILTRYRVHYKSTTMSKQDLFAHEYKYIWERRKRLARGLPRLTRDEFEVLEAKMSPWGVFRQRIYRRGEYHWRAAGLAIGEGKLVEGAAHLTIASAIKPRLVARKMKRQLSRKMPFLEPVTFNQGLAAMGAVTALMVLLAILLRPVSGE